jgi:RNA polymerase sigma-70 factor (ECF subfamily)
MIDYFNQNWVGVFNEGNPNAETRWFKTYFPVILSEVSLRIGESPDTIDQVMEVVVTMLEYKGGFETVKNIKRYLYRVINTVCKEYLKREKEKRTNSRDISKYLKNLTEESREKAIVRDKFRNLQYVATESLPKQCLQVFNLYYHQELSNREIAERLNISEKAVEYHKSIAYKKIRIELNRQKDENGTMLFLFFSIPMVYCYHLIQKLLA